MKPTSTEKQEFLTPEAIAALIERQNPPFEEVTHSAEVPLDKHYQVHFAGALTVQARTPGGARMVAEVLLPPEAEMVGEPVEVPPGGEAAYPPTTASVPPGTLVPDIDCCPECGGVLTVDPDDGEVSCGVCALSYGYHKLWLPPDHAEDAARERRQWREEA